MKREDEDRDARLRREGFQVLRFWNHDVARNAEGVVTGIRIALGLGRETPAPAHMGEGS